MVCLEKAGLFLPNYAYARASSTNATASSKSPTTQENQTRNQTTTAQNHNSTQTMMSSFKSGNELLMQVINDINTGNIQGALAKLNNAKDDAY
jgi:hypothetical protein